MLPPDLIKYSRPFGHQLFLIILQYYVVPVFRDLSPLAHSCEPQSRLLVLCQACLTRPYGY